MTENDPTWVVVALTLALAVGLAAFLTHHRRIIERSRGGPRPNRSGLARSSALVDLLVGSGCSPWRPVPSSPRQHPFGAGRARDRHTEEHYLWR